MPKSSESPILPILCVHTGKSDKGFYALLAREEQVLFKGKMVTKAAVAFMQSKTEDLSDWMGQEFTEEDLAFFKLKLK